ncbi:PREDICTED: myosin-17-like [Camelina sativa]|uniref:Myosin-17-like n=1 Tax=Camelina sativa TaxID=90675 RepID=A0ABM1REF0_CAMSA|nr:PREDICTED: myosin-17-like [Camelina sativa]
MDPFTEADTVIQATRDTGALREREATKKTIEETFPENQEVLVKFISQNLGYDGGKPVAAYVIYKCLIRWRSFEDKRTNIFNRIVQMIASAIEVPDNNEVLAYWLSNLATLFFLLRRMSTNATTPVSGGFQQKLIVFIERIYGMIRDNLEKEILPLLELCIQKPGTIEENTQPLVPHWLSIVESLNSYLNLMKANNVPPFLVSKIFTQVFSFINVQLFNSFLLRRECCSLSHGEYVEAGLAELNKWCVEATDEYAGLAWDELRHIRQAVGFLVIREKPKMTLEEVTRELCPMLSILHLYRISTMYWDGKYGTWSVSSDFVTNMRAMIPEDWNPVTSPFLLDNDSSIPFTVEDMSKSMEQVDVNYSEAPPHLINDDFDQLLYSLGQKVA